MTLQILDISQSVATGIAVWPGDQSFRLDWTMSRQRGDSVNVAALTLSAHTGTHVDAPFHVLPGLRIGELPLDAFIGPAIVVDARDLDPLDERVLPRLGTNPTRVLFRTRNAVDASEFPGRFTYPSLALARRLASAGVRLVGTDAPSMDAFDSKTLDTHHVLAAAGVALLENLVLDHVRPGTYTLVALPLKLAEADASPVRAVLLPAPGGAA